jgi:hypothetical protein
MMGIGFGGGDSFDETWMRYSPAWKADVQPLDEPWRGTRRARAIVVVMAEGSVAYRKLVPLSSVADAAGVADVLAGAVRGVARRATGYPPRLLVRDWAVAARLSVEFERYDLDVSVSPSLREVRHTIRRLVMHIDEPEVAWDLAPLDGWYEADTHPHLHEALFHAAARFRRARPWDRVADGEALLVRWRGRESIAVLTHPMGHGHVLTLFTRAADYESMFGESREPVLAIKFVERAALPREYRRLITRRGWEVPDPGAYPLVIGDGAFGCRQHDVDVHHLSAVLTAVAGWIAAGRGRRPSLPCVDTDSGVELRPEIDFDRVPWPTMKRARPVCASGPAATLRAAEGRAHSEPPREEVLRVPEFEAHLLDTGTRAALARRRAAHALEWARYLDDQAGLPAEAATEYDLRLFLYDWYPRFGQASEEEAERLPAALRHYFRWLGERHGIAYPWAAAVLGEREAFLARLEVAPVGQHVGDEEGGSGELARWHLQLAADLDTRVLLHDRGFPDLEEAPARGYPPRTAALVRELQRRWLVWRDELVASGVTAPEPLRAALVGRQREWERTTHPEYGASPIRVVADEGSSADG